MLLKNKTLSLQGYCLTTAVLVVRNIETQQTRSAVFAEIKSKNPVFRLVDKLYDLAGYLFLQPVILFAYMIKSVLSVGPELRRDSELVTIGNFDNERHSIERVLALSPEIQVTNLGLGRHIISGFLQLDILWHFMKVAPRCGSFLRRLSRSYGFMPACRIASVLAYYVFFDRMFRKNPNLKAVLVASNYSPEALGIAAAAHENGCKVIYANHAPVPRNSAYVPPVLSDCAVFYGEAIRNTYQVRSRCASEVVLIGQPVKAQPMKWKEKITTVGIFLTALTRSDALKKLVTSMKSENPGINILIRHHPVALLETDVSELVETYPGITTTRGTPLDDDIAKCDLIFCGNSGVSMNILCGGRPVAYLAELDELPHDYLGFVSQGLQCEVQGWVRELYTDLRRFYDNEQWLSLMQTHDASYGISKSEITNSARLKLGRWLS